MPRKLPTFDLDHAITLYRSGQTLREVGDALGVGWYPVWKRLRDAGIERRPRGVIPDATTRVAVDDGEIIRRYRAGESEKALSEAFGVDRSTIRTRLRRGGVEPRGRSAAMVQRWADLDDAGREALVAAAHVATRGRVRTDDEVAATARTRSALSCFTSPWEVVVADLLAERGMRTDPQRAAHRYNIDLAAWPVAVEVHRQITHPLYRRAARQRTVDLLDRGWRIIFVWVHPRVDRVDPACADEVVALAQLAERDPSAFGEYRVVHGSLDNPARGRTHSYDLTDVRRPE